ncbi:DNA/RNA non-specific endonuclease [Streptomyces sp. NPDC005921]
MSALRVPALANSSSASRDVHLRLRRAEAGRVRRPRPVPGPPVRPPGYTWAQDYARHLKANPSRVVNNCHLLGRQLGGSGTDLRNLATCGVDANTYPPRGGLGAMDNMVQFEDRVAGEVAEGDTVLYRVVPVYAGDRVVPKAFVMTATSWDADGNPLGTQRRDVPNLMNTRSGWKNLGTVVHSRTGEDVPTP